MMGKRLQLAATMSGLLLVVGTAFAVSAPPIEGAARYPATTVEDSTIWYIDAELILLLESTASAAASRVRRDGGSPDAVEASVSMDMKRRVITADFGPGFKPSSNDAELMLRPLALTLRYHAEQAGLPINGVEFRVEGRVLKQYDAEDLAVPSKVRNGAQRKTGDLSPAPSSHHSLFRVSSARPWHPDTARRPARPCSRSRPR